MAVLKCKMCGGDVELAGDKTFGTCEYCGCTMTFPKVDDEQRAAAFNRGNHFRRIGEFDKALAVYERMVQEDDTDAEAHWCCALCRFGIEYVEDPATMEWLPTCHRASFDSFLDDVDYLAAVEHSAGITQKQYQKDAAKIAEVQKGILATSQNAEPYDVFICYKETDAQGNRTKDSMLAQDIYYQLTEQGRRVFFARITLEDVAGAQYEPYIFAALNSAKVMIVVGTTAENLSAVWVKNEWSRFLSLMKKDHGKLLLPCYRDMDPYDLPEQLSVLQSYDMAKIGFIQDLTRGIAKVLDAEKKPTTVVKETIVTGGGGNVAPLLKRAFMYLEDGDWEKADAFCEQVLNVDPECAEAYLGKLMAELQVHKREDLKNQKQPFDTQNLYQKVIRFGDAKLQAELKGYNEYIVERNRETAYTNAVSAMNAAATEQQYKAAAEEFGKLSNYKDAAQRAQECIAKAEEARKEDVYRQSVSAMKKRTNADVNRSITGFRSVLDWKDSAAKLEECKELLKQLQEERAEQKRAAEEKRLKAEQEAMAKAKRKKRRTIVTLISIVLAGLIGYFGVYPYLAYQQGDYKVYIDMYHIEEFTVPEGVTEIKDSAFDCCNSLTSVTIPDSVTSIGVRAFYVCTSLTSIEVDNKNPNYCSVDGVLFNKDKTTLIQCPGGKAGAYTIPDSVTTIGDSAFYYCTSLTSVTIGDSVTSIGYRAFYDCDSLTNVYFKGTMSQWKALYVYFGHSVKVHCSDGTIEDS